MTDARPLAAALWMLGSVFAFTGMAVAARNIGTAHDSLRWGSGWLWPLPWPRGGWAR